MNSYRSKYGKDRLIIINNAVQTAQSKGGFLLSKWGTATLPFMDIEKVGGDYDYKTSSFLHSELRLIPMKIDGTECYIAVLLNTDNAETYKDAMLVSAPYEEGYVICDTINKDVCVKTASQEITLDGISIFGEEMLLQEIQKELWRNGIRIVPTEIEFFQGEPKNKVWKGDKIPRITGSDVSISGTGHVIDTNNNSLIYIGATGWVTSLRGVWAGLVKSGTRWVSIQSKTVQGLPGKYHTHMAKMPKMNMSQMRMVHFLATESSVDTTKNPFVYAIEFMDMPEFPLNRMIYQRISDCLNIPILSKWENAVIAEARSRLIIVDIEANGDAVAAVRISLDEDNWKNMIQDLLEKGEIKP